MPTREAEAIILRQYSLAEADRIIVLMTRDAGTQRAVAQGVKKPRSRLGGCLEPLNHVRLQLYMKEGADLGRIWHCEIVHSYLGKNPTLDRVFGFSYLAELTQEMAPENNPNAILFRLFLAVLDAGESLGCSPALLRYFEIWALKLNGWLPNYDYCSSCRKCVKDEGFYILLEAGQGRCRSCAEDRGMRIGPDAAILLNQVLLLSPSQFAERPQSGYAARDLERLTQKLIEWHLEKRLKSYLAWKELHGSETDPARGET
jgi:DNA repair protein RecO (recombination protein O)